MLSSALESARNAAWNAAKLAILARGALIFLTLAAFIWAEGAYGALAAAAGLGAVFLVLALAFAALARIEARSRSSRGSQALQQAGQDRAVSRLLGPKNVLPAVVLGAVILAAAQAVPRSKSKAGAAE